MPGEILAIAATFTFVLSSAMFRKVENTLSAVQISAFRTSVGLFTFYFLSIYYGFFRYAFSLPPKIIFYLVISIVAGQVIGDTLYLYTQEKIGTTLSITLSTTFPFFTFLVAFIVRNETVPNSFIVSATLISIGVMLISRGKVSYKSSKSHNVNPLAIGLGLLSSFAWGVATVYTDLSLDLVSQSIPDDIDPTITGNLIRFPIATIALITLSIRDSKTPLAKIDKKTFAWVFSASIIGTALGAYLWAESARIAGASLSALIYSASPLFALPIGYLLNSEKINLYGITGALVTAIGVSLIFI